MKLSSRNLPFCVCPFCQIGFHGDKGEDGSDCPECGEWIGADYCVEEINDEESYEARRYVC